MMQNSFYKLEIAAFTPEAAIKAQHAGANRIELCDNPHDGGTTPSIGMLELLRRLLDIELFPIIRPRGGDFLYTDLEFEIMKKDIIHCRQIGCDGIVTGILNADGSIDKKRNSILIDLAYPMSVSFHRAFDRCKDPFQSLEDIIELGFERILTSGQQPTALEGALLIHELVKLADDRIIIMPGSGVRDDNIEELIIKTGAREFHTAARISKNSVMQYHNPAMKESSAITDVDEQMIRNIINIFHKQSA
jgi:copper homeostasis protein